MAMPLNKTEESVNFDCSTIRETTILKPFQFELQDWKPWAVFVHNHWYFALLAAVIYIPVIFAIKHFMKERKAFNLKSELITWNIALGLFSIVGFLRTAPELLNTLLQKDGFHSSVCERVWTRPELFWTFLFCFSKYVELGDTIFIVLRKKPLVVLQWVHHIVTLGVAWIVLPFLEPISKFIVVMNFGVHSLMYPYFALKALDVKIPQILANLLTTLQLTQILAYMAVQFYSGYFYYYWSSCYRHPTSMIFVTVATASFIILFGDLFFRLVVRQNRMKTPRKMD